VKRLNLPEAMDGTDLDPTLLAEDLRNLEMLNRWFGGRSVVRRRLRGLLAVRGQAPLTVLDIGSGAGDLVRAVVEECRARGVPVRVCSLDAHPQVQTFARERLADLPEVRFLRADAACLPLHAGSVDLALCTLALHHFTEEAATAVLAEMRRVARSWAVVSDLYRAPAAYAAVWFATRFTANPMTRKDGPLSVQRAFTPGELRALAAQAGWVQPRFHREPWFRMSLIETR
jgi:ubiquinone/menaquinone biosynthesis C-methylase UbiE